MFTEQEVPANVNDIYEQTKASYYGKTSHNVPPLPLPPTPITAIHSMLIADYEKQHNYHAKDVYDFINSQFQLLGIDMHHDFLEHCILHASNLLPMLQQYYADTMYVRFSLNPNQHESNPASEEMCFYIGIDMMKTFGFGNSWPIFHDTVVPQICKNLKVINAMYVPGYNALNSSAERRDENYTNLQYRFSLNIACVAKTFLTNPIFTAQYLLEKESSMDDKGFVLSACEYLLQEIPVFIGLKNGIPNTLTDSLIINLTTLSVQCNSLKENQTSVVASERISEHRARLFYYEEKSDEDAEQIDNSNSLHN